MTKKDTRPSLKQLTLKEAADKVRPWDINNDRAQAAHRCAMEMIALNSQPISIVEDPGFTRLLFTLEPRHKLPSRDST